MAKKSIGSADERRARTLHERLALRLARARANVREDLAEDERLHRRQELVGAHRYDDRRFGAHIYTALARAFVENVSRERLTWDKLHVDAQEKVRALLEPLLEQYVVGRAGKVRSGLARTGRRVDPELVYAAFDDIRPKTHSDTEAARLMADTKMFPLRRDPSRNIPLKRSAILDYLKERPKK